MLMIFQQLIISSVSTVEGNTVKLISKTALKSICKRSKEKFVTRDDKSQAIYCRYSPSKNEFDFWLSISWVKLLGQMLVSQIDDDRHVIRTET